MAVIPKQRLWRAAALVNPVLVRGGDALRRMPLVHLHRLAIAGVAIYCCHVLAGLFWLLVPLPNPVEPGYIPVADSRAAISGAADLRVDIDALKDMYLFGKPGMQDAESQPPATVVVEAEETRLDLLLMGLVVSDVEGSARAVIAHRNQQDLFGVGDTLPGGAQVSLHQVLPGRIIIENAGKYESLWLYEEQPAQRKHEQPLKESKALAKAVPIPVEKPQVAPEPAAKPARIAVDELVGEPQTLADIIQFTAVHAEGKVLGYRVAPGRAPEIFDKVGLKNNDIITSVNGITLDDPTRALKIYRGLQNADSASFEVVRDGKTRLLDVQLDHSGNRG